MNTAASVGRCDGGGGTNKKRYEKRIYATPDGCDPFTS